MPKTGLLPPSLPIVVVCDNWRSCQNVGSILRSARRFGLDRVVFIGTTPYPHLAGDSRRPDLIAKQTRAIAKSALGAEAGVNGRHYPSRADFLTAHRGQLANLVLIEQTGDSRPLTDWSGPADPSQPVWLVLGGEVDGVGQEFLRLAPAWEIPVVGSRQSLNVAVAGGICLYQLVYLRSV